MGNNKFIKLCLELLGHWKSSISISQYINVYLHHLLHSILNIRCERFLKQFHEIAVFGNVPDSIHRADE